MSYRHTMTLFGVCLPICLVLRVLQLIFTIDSTTGFIKQQYSAISVIIMLVIFAGIISVGLIGFACDGIKFQKKEINPVTSLTSFLTGGMFIYDTAALVASASIAAWYDKVLLLFGLLSAAVFIAFGIKKIYMYKFPSILLVVPVFYYIVRLISIFVSTSALSLVTKNIFLLFANGALLIFMFEFSKTENKIDDTPKIKKLFSAAIVASMFCFVQALPRIIVYGASMSGRDMADALLTLTISLFVISYMISEFADDSIGKNVHTAKHLAE